MEIKKLVRITESENNVKLEKATEQFEQLLSELRKRELPVDVINHINAHIEQLNGIAEPKAWIKTFRKAKHSIVTRAEKELKLVTKGHYQTMWTALGMTTFGLPIGVAFAFAIDNMAFLAIGLPIGLPIGIAVGANMDKKAEEEGRQLDVALGYI